MKVGGVLDELRVITRRATTSLDARPLVATLPAEIHAPMFSARLTDSSSGGPVAGRLVTFASLDDATVHCSGSTDPDGMASCPYGTTLATAVLDGGYRATFAGDDTFDSSTGVAPLARVLGIDIP
jgi:hypothetical protein